MELSKALVGALMLGLCGCAANRQIDPRYAKSVKSTSIVVLMSSSNAQANDVTGLRITSIKATRTTNTLGNPAIQTELGIAGLTVGATNLVLASLNLSDSGGFNRPWSFIEQFVATSDVACVTFSKAQALYQTNVFFLVKQLP